MTPGGHFLHYVKLFFLFFIAEEAGLRTRALEAQLANEKNEKEKLLESFNQEKEKLLKQIKQMETQKTQEHQQSQTVKPTVSSAPSTARVKSQPQVSFFCLFQCLYKL